ncbi:aldehyde dehydrogenase family protein [Streptomyces sp. NPDC057908]|uniref:aldehyde dehydrogenase family protein n=1 Tax=Streptomyces sp. NPDC057908 TaxID=3346276 RepID=UPI0036EF3FA0
MRVGDPSDASDALGPLIDTRQRDRVHSVVTGAVAKGAILAAGGAYDGLYYQPTVLTDVTSDNLAWSEEIFGPVAPIQIIPHCI